MEEHFFLELMKLLWKGLGYLVENCPDNPRLGWKLVFCGALMAGIFVPTISPQLADFVFLAVPGFFAGCICLLLGAFVFFRRWVWRWQDHRAPVITSLNLK